MHPTHRDRVAAALNAKGHTVGTIFMADLVDAFRAHGLVVMEVPVEEARGRDAFNLVARAKSEIEDLLYALRHRYIDTIRLRTSHVVKLMSLIQWLAERDQIGSEAKP